MQCGFAVLFHICTVCALFLPTISSPAKGDTDAYEAMYCILTIHMIRGQSPSPSLILHIAVKFDQGGPVIIMTVDSK